MNAVLDVGPIPQTVEQRRFLDEALSLFRSLQQEEALKPTRCLEPSFYSQISAHSAGPSRSLLARNLEPLTLWLEATLTCEATVAGSPTDLSGCWKKGLYSALASDQDWRTPQVLVASFRKHLWPTSPLTTVHAPACGNASEVPPRDVPLVILDDYNSHPRARSDRDPWDLRPYHPPLNPPGHHLCLLPKPPHCHHLRAGELPAALLHSHLLLADEIWHYIPPANWSPDTIPPHRWRNGQAFPHGTLNGRQGYEDRGGRVWHWDQHEEHWDVQCSNGYVKVSETGVVLARHLCT